MNQQTNPQPEDITTKVGFVALIVISVVGVDLWLGANAAAWLSSRQWLDINAGAFGKALVKLPANMSNPAAAFPEPAASRLPGPIIYWGVTLLINVVLLVAAFYAWKFFRPAPDTLDKRKRLGVDTQPRFAEKKHLKKLIVRRPEPGRFLLGRAKTGQLLATEPYVRPEGWKGERPHPGPVIFIGPTRCGKTYAAIVGINAWRGPAILSSVKTDLLNGTFAARSALGEVKIYDPSGDTGLARAQWTPLHRAKDILEAERIADLLISASTTGGGARDRFWSEQGASLLGGLLWLAAVTDHTMADVAGWIRSYDQPSDDNAGEVAPLLRSLVGGGGAHSDQARSLLKNFGGIWGADSRMTSSFYVSARLAVNPWANPTVQATAVTNEIDLEWLTSGNNTLYLCAPVIDQARMAPALGGLIGDLVTQAIIRRGGLRTELLLLLDEAANTPLTQLPGWCSMITGFGVQIVSIWQSKSQIDDTYGQGADALLSNSRSRVFFSGAADRAGLSYVNELVGREHQLSVMTGNGRGSDPYDRATPTAIDVVPANVLRQMDSGDALLIHGNLPPVHLLAIDRLPRTRRHEHQ